MYFIFKECEVLFKTIFGRTQSLSNILAKNDLPIVGPVDQNVFETSALIVLERKSSKIDCSVVKSVLH